MKDIFDDALPDHLSAQKTRDALICGCIEYVPGNADLFDAAIQHHSHARGELKRLL